MRAEDKAKVKMKVRVRVLLEIEGTDTWSQDVGLAQVFEQGLVSARHDIAALLAVKREDGLDGMRIAEADSVRRRIRVLKIDESSVRVELQTEPLAAV